MINFEKLLPEQRRIAETLDKPLFVAAGAGSGKTFTLTQRVVWALSNGSGEDGRPFAEQLDEILVITFTDAAASEIKERVRTELYAAGMAAHARAVDSAWISTIHSMCARILRRHALDLGLDPAFTVASENTRSALLSKALETVFETAFCDERYAPLWSAFPARGGFGGVDGSQSVAGMITKLIECAAGALHGFDSLVWPGEPPNTRDLLTYLLEEYDVLRACSINDMDEHAQCIEAAADLAAYLKDHRTPSEDDALDFVCGMHRLDGRKWRSKASKQCGNNARFAYGKVLAELSCARAHRVAHLLEELARAVYDRFMALKSERSLLDHDDLLSYTLRAMRDYACVREHYVDRFKLVMIDEFQDTATQQVEICRMLAGKDACHLAIVGDAQQSIYRFRGADVEVFRNFDASIQARIAADPDAAARIEMFVNFRSHDDILRFVAAVCGASGTEAAVCGASGAGATVCEAPGTEVAACEAPGTEAVVCEAPGTEAVVSEAPGTEAQPLLAGFKDLSASSTRRDGYKASALPRIAIELTTTTKTKPHGASVCSAPSSHSAVDVAAVQLADRLVQYVQAGHAAGDIALLLGTMSHAGQYVDALRARGLDCIIVGGSTFAKTPEVATVVALLRTLASPRDTRSGLYKTLISDLFCLDASDLIALGTCEKKSTGASLKRRIDAGIHDMTFVDGMAPTRRLMLAHDVLERAWARLGTENTADVLLALIRESGWLTRLEAAGVEGRAQAANVLAAVRYVRELADEGHFGPARTADEFERWLASVKVGPASLVGGAADAVRVMTIHASKGLEFPLVAVADMPGTSKNEAGAPLVTITHGHEVYASLLVTDSRFDTEKPINKALDVVRKADDGQDSHTEHHATPLAWRLHLEDLERTGAAEESARLLYVALTRAREAIVLSMTAPCLAGGEIDSRVLASEVCGALFSHTMPDVGESTFSYAGSRDGVVRRCDVRFGDTKDTIVVDSSGSCLDAEGVYSEVETALDETSHDLMALSEGRTGRTFVFCGDRTTERPAERLVSPREDVCSYSSIKRMLSGPHAAHTADQAQVYSVSTTGINGSGEAFCPDDADDDRATDLGSAFHELAEHMLVMRRLPSEDTVAAAQKRWSLTRRQCLRLEKALVRWERSALRKELLSWKYVSAEVPFLHVLEEKPFVRFGRWLDGTFDALGHDGSGTRALIVDYKTGQAFTSQEDLQKAHELQARLYAHALLRAGYTQVECAFVCVELDDGTGEPTVIRYHFGTS